METKVKTLAYEFCTLQAADAFRAVVDKSNGYWDGQTRWRFLVMDADRAYTGKSVMLVADDRTTPARRGCRGNRRPRRGCRMSRWEARSPRCSSRSYPA